MQFTPRAPDALQLDFGGAATASKKKPENSSPAFDRLLRRASAEAESADVTAEATTEVEETTQEQLVLATEEV